MSKSKPTATYKLIRWLIKTVYPKIEVVGAENLPDEGAIIIGNHTQMNGPIAGEIYFPGAHYIWCAKEMMHREDVPAYTFEDFWSQKPKWTRPFYKLLSHLITPLSVCIFNNAHTIEVYRDAHIMSTFKETLAVLKEDANVIIFPEHDVPHNNIVYDFQKNFVDVAKLCHKRLGRELAFVPMYLAPKLRKLYLGKPIRFCPDNPIEEERTRICTYCMEEITAIARALPEHTVVPYRNIGKKNYPKNTDTNWMP